MKVGDLVKYKAPLGVCGATPRLLPTLGIIIGRVPPVRVITEQSCWSVLWATGRKKTYPPRLLEVIA